MKACVGRYEGGDGVDGIVGVWCKEDEGEDSELWGFRVISDRAVARICASTHGYETDDENRMRGPFCQ